MKYIRLRNYSYTGWLLSALILLGIFMGCDYRTPSTSNGNDGQTTYYMEAQVDRNVIYADNGKTVAKVRVSLQNAESEPLANKQINFAATSGLITSAATTNTSGLAIATFDDKGIEQDSVLIVSRYTDANQSTIRDTVYVTVLSVTELVDNIRFTPLPNVLVENTTTSYSVPVKVNVLDDAPTPIENVPVHFRLENQGNPLGTLSSNIDTSDQSGGAQVTFSSFPGAIGEVVITAYITGNDAEMAMNKYGALFDLSGLAKSADAVAFAATDTFHLASPEPYNMTLVTSRDTIYVDNGASFARIKAVITDSEDQPVKNASVRFSSSGTVGVINSPVQTDSTGVAEAHFADLGDRNRIGTSTIRATYSHPFFGILTDSVNVTVTLRETPDTNTPASITVTADDYILDATNNTTQIHATVLDSTGEKISGTLPVFFSLSPPGRGIIDEIAITDENSTATAGFSSGSQAGVVRVQATVVLSEDEEVTGTTALQIRPGELKYITIPPASPNKIQVKDGGGLETTTLRAELYDADGQLVANPPDGRYEVEFELGALHPEGANINNQGPSATVEANNGIATATLNSGTEAGNVRIYARVDLGDTVISATTIPVVIEAGFPTFIFAEWDPSSITQAGGGIYEMELAALVRDRYSNPVPDSTQVYWFIADDSAQAHVDGTSFTGNENLNEESYAGVSFTRFRWPTRTTFNPIEIHARTYGGPDDTAYVETVVTLPDGSLPLIPFHPGQLQLSANPGAWDFTTDGGPDGSTEVDITLSVFLANSYDTPIQGAPIQFFFSRPPNAFDPEPPVFTNQNGMASTVATFSRSICPQVPNTDPPQYETVDVTVRAQLMLPQITTSNEVILTFSRSFDGGLRVEAKEKVNN